MSAKTYIESFDTFFKHSEEESLKMLIESHKRLRDAEVARGDFWRALPIWKQKLARFLGLTLWP